MPSRTRGSLQLSYPVTTQTWCRQMLGKQQGVARSVGGFLSGDQQEKRSVQFPESERAGAYERSYWWHLVTLMSRYSKYFSSEY